jgi:hypothetical protein
VTKSDVGHRSDIRELSSLFPADCSPPWRHLLGLLPPRGATLAVFLLGPRVCRSDGPGAGRSAEFCADSPCASCADWPAASCAARGNRQADMAMAHVPELLSSLPIVFIDISYLIEDAIGLPGRQAANGSLQRDRRRRLARSGATGAARLRDLSKSISSRCWIAITYREPIRFGPRSAVMRHRRCRYRIRPRPGDPPVGPSH